MNTVNPASNDFVETAIDFSQYQIIAVFEAVKGNGGWSIDITAITEYADSITVPVKNLHTGDDTCVMTQPFCIVKIPVSDKKVVFDWEGSYLQNQEGCAFENPLTDLLWLKKIIDEYEADAAWAITQGRQPPHARIYQCTYKDGIGFLLEMCVGCPDFGYKFLNCEGVNLCSVGGLADNPVSCDGFDIDFDNKTLIWERNSESVISCEFENPLTDLLWLKKIVEEFTAYSETVSKRHFKIYQCTYFFENVEKIGFIVTPICVDCGDDTAMLYDCSGTKQCAMGGMLGACEEYKITNKNLIWEINN